ncbi:hypothetical protein BH11ARM1_BH11ARM1_01090 [soil metagenome]
MYRTHSGQSLFEDNLDTEVFEAARKACLRIPPVWELENYVAVNPFMGFIDQPIEDAAPVIEDGLIARMLPGGDPISSSPNGRFSNTFDDWLSTWLASFVSMDSWSSMSLFDAWRRFSLSDATLEASGLKGWNRWLESCAESTQAVFNSEYLSSNRNDLEMMLYRLLGRQYGWACLMRRQSWGSPNEEPRLLLELLAVLVVIDKAKDALLKDPKIEREPKGQTQDIGQRLSALEQKENDYVQELSKSILPGGLEMPSAKPKIQAVFCIDVRSERLRRALERSSEVETLGFAGFFGVSLNITDGISSSPRCPVLLKPGILVKSLSQTDGLTQNVPATPSKFIFVELTGLFKVVSLVKAVLTRRSKPSGEETSEIEFAGEVSLKERVSVAASILKNTGLASRLASVVILCGHTSCSENNPQAAGLECGACGGHGGAMNARVAAQWLNDSLVRSSLRDQGFEIPSETVFIPAVHDTSSDEVRFLDHGKLNEMDDHGKKLKTMFESASESVRAERSTSLGIANTPRQSQLKVFRQRASDWSEICPEWGLARNASFIIARRERTRGVNLDGRAFLHEYDAVQDPDQSILAMILAAPMVVASWINWQYLASTVDNDRFGAGPKPLQNPIGSLGLIKGHHGDFCTGLSRESVHLRDGSWFHEPLRLQVVAEAMPLDIDRAISESEMVSQLVDNGWVRIFSLNRESQSLQIRSRGGEWIPYNEG